jgi:hypothetical protein
MSPHTRVTCLHELLILISILEKSYIIKIMIFGDGGHLIRRKIPMLELVWASIPENCIQFHENFKSHAIKDLYYLTLMVKVKLSLCLTN